MTEFEKFQKVQNDCDEINEIICAAYIARYFGDMQISEIQALLTEILSTVAERTEPEEMERTNDGFTG